MIVTVHQPNYLPYLGFFHKMAAASTLVLYDTAQFSKNEFHNRNRVKTPKGPHWLTVPVSGAAFKPIHEVAIADQTRWGERHWETIQANYARAPFFETYRSELAKLYGRSWTRLVDANAAFLDFLAKALDVTTRVRLASELGVDASLSPSEKLAELVRRADGDAYLSGVGGLNYLEPTAFADVHLLLQDFRHPEYRQQWGPFLPNLSVVDLLLNVGDGAGRIVKGAGGVREWPR